MRRPQERRGISLKKHLYPSGKHTVGSVRERGKFILLVEDSVLIRKLYSEVLRKAGYHVAEACDGFDALRVLGEAERNPDLLLTDFQMPGMDGVQLALQVRQECPGIAVLLASASPDHLKYAKNLLPFATCLHKTSSPAELLTSVARLLH